MLNAHSIDLNNQRPTRITNTQDAMVKTNAGIEKVPIVTRAMPVPKNSFNIPSDTVSPPLILFLRLLRISFSVDNLAVDKKSINLLM
jgi:hypothetical protein